MRNDLISVAKYGETYHAKYYLDDIIMGYNALDEMFTKDLGTFLLNLTEVFLDSVSPPETN